MDPSDQCLVRAGRGRTDITIGAEAGGYGNRADGHGHLIRDMSGGGLPTSATATATSCIKGTGCAADSPPIDLAHVRAD